VLALALCLTLTPIWRGWGPVLSYPWWFSLGFAAFTWSAVAWLKWSETNKKSWAVVTACLLSIALCTSECFSLSFWLQRLLCIGIYEGSISWLSRFQSSNEPLDSVYPLRLFGLPARWNFS
jgi:hypothetical protein